MTDNVESRVTSDALRALFRVPKIETLIVTVPSASAPDPGTWKDQNSRQWLRSIPSSMAPGLAVFVFDSFVTNSGADAWSTVLEKGNIFLKALLSLTRNEKLVHCPIILVSHGVEGLVIKDALRRAFERPADFQRLLQALAGIVLLGTPHSTSENVTDWESIVLLQESGLMPKKKSKADKEGIERFANFSLNFERARMPTPILSVHELLPTKVEKKFPFPNKQHLLTSRKFVTTHAHREEVLAFNCDHKSLCSINTACDEFTQLLSFLDIVLEEARLHIVTGSPQYKAAPALDDWTVMDYGKDSEAKEGDEISGTPTGKQPVNRPDGTSESSSRRQSESFSKDATAGSSEGEFEMIPQLPSASSVRQGSRLPCYILPISRNKHFFGRVNVLRQIAETFFPSSEAKDASQAGDANEAKSFAICGPGGMGKTQAAAEFVFTHKNKFDAIFWVFADTTEKLHEGFSKIAVELGLVDRDSIDSRDEVVTRELVKGWLANPLRKADPLDEGLNDRASWLLVLDNADHLEEIEDILPLDGPGCVLLTSRDPVAREVHYQGMTGVNLEPLGSEEGTSLLTTMTGRAGDSASIVHLLGGLPLAMTQMAGVIVRRDLSFADFIDTYNEEEGRREMLQLNLTPKARRTGYEHTVASVWALDNLKHGRTLLEILSFLDPDGVPDAVLTTHPTAVSLDGFPKSAFAYQTARTELSRCSLVTKTVDTIQVHRLVQDAARTKLDKVNLGKVFAAATALVASVWPFEAFGWRHGVARWHRCERVFPQVLSLEQHHRRLGVSPGSFEEDLQLAKLLTDAGWYAHESGKSVDSSQYFADAQLIAERLRDSMESNAAQPLPRSSSPNHVDSLLAEIHHNIGCVSTETNDPEGTLVHFKIFNHLVAKEAESGAAVMDKRLAISWNELGNAYMLNDMYESGKDAFDKSIGIMKDLEGFQWTDISFPCVNLGLAYWLTGRLKDALGVLLDGIGHREAAYGKDDDHSFITGRFLHALGNVKASQGSEVEAFEYHRRALAQYLSTIGKNHHRTGDVYFKVAEHHEALHEHGKALLCFDQALRIFELRSIHKPEYARALFSKSLTLEALGRVEEAHTDRESSGAMYHELLRGKGDMPKRTDELVKADFDDIIAFWSR